MPSRRLPNAGISLQREFQTVGQQLEQRPSGWHGPGVVGPQDPQRRPTPSPLRQRFNPTDGPLAGNADSDLDRSSVFYPAGCPITPHHAQTKETQHRPPTDRCGFAGRPGEPGCWTGDDDQHVVGQLATNGSGGQGQWLSSTRSAEPVVEHRPRRLFHCTDVDHRAAAAPVNAAARYASAKIPKIMPCSPSLCPRAFKPERPETPSTACKIRWSVIASGMARGWTHAVRGSIVALCSNFERRHGNRDHSRHRPGPYLAGEGALERAAWNCGSPRPKSAFTSSSITVWRATRSPVFDQVKRVHACPLERKLVYKIDPHGTGYPCRGGNTLRTSTVQTGHQNPT